MTLWRLYQGADTAGFSHPALGIAATTTAQCTLASSNRAWFYLVSSSARQDLKMDLNIQIFKDHHSVTRFMWGSISKHAKTPKMMCLKLNLHLHRSNNHKEAPLQMQLRSHGLLIQLLGFKIENFLRDFSSMSCCVKYCEICGTSKSYQNEDVWTYILNMCIYVTMCICIYI